MFRRVLSLCVALVFVAGASGGLFAQEEVDIRIEVVSPASGTALKIGDVITVNVYAAPGFIDTMEVALGDTIAVVNGELGAVSAANYGEIADETLSLESSWADSVTATRAKPGESIDTFKAKITLREETINAREGEQVEVHVRFVAKDVNGDIPALATWTYASNASTKAFGSAGGRKSGR